MNMFKNVIDNKEIIKKNDIEIVDFISSIFNDKKTSDIVFNLYRVPDSMKMRIDLISLAAYGSDEYADILLKYNGISNPFTINTNDILLIPTLDTVENDLKELKIKNDSANKIRNYHKYIDKSKAPNNIGSQQLDLKINKDVEYKEANIADAGAASITLRNGRIYFGDNNNVLCAADGISVSDFMISKIENDL